MTKFSNFEFCNRAHDLGKEFARAVKKCKTERDLNRVIDLFKERASLTGLANNRVFDDARKHFTRS